MPSSCCVLWFIDLESIRMLVVTENFSFAFWHLLITFLLEVFLASDKSVNTFWCTLHRILLFYSSASSTAFLWILFSLRLGTLLDMSEYCMIRIIRSQSENTYCFHEKFKKQTCGINFHLQTGTILEVCVCENLRFNWGGILVFEFQVFL